MAIINRCCFWQNVRSGSFAAGFYSLILYTLILTAGVLNLYAVLENTGMFVLSLVMIIFSVFCVIASVLLLIGLCVDSRKLLIPWLILVLVTTCVDLIISLYLLIEALFNPFLAILFAVDFLILSLNTYSLLCVYSQYQEYCEGRGNPQVRGNRPLPDVEYLGDRGGASNSARMTNDSAATHSSAISVVQSSSVQAVHSDVNLVEESSAQSRNMEEVNLSEIKEDIQSDVDAFNAQKNAENTITFIIDSEEGQEH